MCIAFVFKSMHGLGLNDWCVHGNNKWITICIYTMRHSFIVDHQPFSCFVRQFVVAIPTTDRLKQDSIVYALYT